MEKFAGMVRLAGNTLVDLGPGEPSCLLPYLGYLEEVAHVVGKVKELLGHNKMHGDTRESRQ